MGGGLAVGVAFGAVGAVWGYETGTLGGAIALGEIGIGLQNCPEGTWHRVPLRREGIRREELVVRTVVSGVEPMAGATARPPSRDAPDPALRASRLPPAR